MTDHCFVAVFPSFLFCASSLSLVIFGAYSSFLELDSKVVVSTKMGFVSGEIIILNISGVEKLIVTQFLGIPYAEPPVGNLRFKKPVKNFGWMLKGVLNATVLKSHCHANKVAKQYKLDDTFVDDERLTVEDFDLEDCLYINIYVPGNLSLGLSRIDAMGLPVLVMITENEEDNRDAVNTFRHLASYCKVVLVDISYRSGIMSYLTLTDGQIAFGNNGFHDQNMALLWVWDNIREFGGDPEKITVFAESDESFSLGYHILQPESRKVIAKAIMHGGTILTPGYLQNNNSDVSHIFNAAVKCRCNITVSVVDCLQLMSLRNLLIISDSVWENFGSWKRHNVYKQHLSLQPLNLPLGEHFNQIDLLIGFNENDGHCLLKKIFQTEASNDLSHKYSEPMIKNFLENVFEVAHHSDKILDTILDALMFEYSSCDSCKQNATRFLSEIILDMMFRAPADLTARLASDQENKVYVYSLSSKNYDCKGIKSLIQFHEEALWNSGQQLTKSLLDMLMNFVKYGNPNPLKELEDWKSFSKTDRNIVLITDETKWLQCSTQKRKMAFWNDYFPYLLQSDADSCPFNTVALDSTLTGNNEMKDFLWLGGVIVGAVILFSVFLGTMLCIHYLKNTRESSCFGKCCLNERRTDQSLMRAAESDESRTLHPLPYSDES